jgi:hypothetical protein
MNGAKLLWPDGRFEFQLMNALTQKSGFLFHISRERVLNLREPAGFHNIIFCPKQFLSRCERSHGDYSLKAENLLKALSKPGQIDLI